MHHDSCLVACSCVVSSSCVTCRPSSPSMVELIHFEGCLSSRRHHTGEHVQQFRPQTAFAQFAGIFSLASPLIAAPRFPGVRQDLLTSQPALTECQTPSPNQPCGPWRASPSLHCAFWRTVPAWLATPWWSLDIITNVESCCFAWVLFSISTITGIRSYLRQIPLLTQGVMLSGNQCTVLEEYLRLL